MGHLYDSQATLDLSFVVRTLSELFRQHFSSSDIDLRQFLLDTSFWDHGGQFKLLLSSQFLPLVQIRHLFCYFVLGICGAAFLDISILPQKLISLIRPLFTFLIAA